MTSKYLFVCMCTNFILNSVCCLDLMHSDDQIDGSTPNTCWKEIYCRLKEKQRNVASGLDRDVCQGSGSYMFGFSNPQIRQLIQVFEQITLQVLVFLLFWQCIGDGQSNQFFLTIVSFYTIFCLKTSLYLHNHLKPFVIGISFHYHSCFCSEFVQTKSLYVFMNV